MTWLSHTIFLFFTVALALLASTLMMFSLTRTFPDADPTVVVVVSVAIASLLPLGVALASRRWLRRGQPVAAWLVACAVIVTAALIATLGL